MASKVKRFEVRIEQDRFDRYREAFDQCKAAQPDISFMDWVREALDIHARQAPKYLAP